MLSPHANRTAREAVAHKKITIDPTGMLLMGTAEALGAHFNGEIAHGAKVVKDSGIKMRQQ